MKPFKSVSLVAPCRDPQSLWDDVATSPESFGCLSCVDRSVCGGAHKAASFFSCDDYCRCPDKANCDLVCRGNPKVFVERLREVNGLDLMAAARAPVVAIEPLPSMLPLIEHGSARDGELNFPIVAVPLYDLVDLEKGILRFADRATLAKRFGISPSARLVISGVGRDRKIERYWALPDRPSLLAQLQRLNITLITPPNFSVLTDVPRTDNLHAMKRIMIAFTEMTQAGLPTALHINARTERDYEQWATAVASRHEIQCLAVEFATGAGRGNRIEWHVAQLRNLADRVGRPLRLVLRGGGRVIEALRQSFDAVSMIDTDAFNKTRCRKQAYFTEAGKLVWRSFPTSVGEPLDHLLQHNVATLHSHHTYLERLHRDRRLTAVSSPGRSIQNRDYKAV